MSYKIGETPFEGMTETDPSQTPGHDTALLTLYVIENNGGSDNVIVLDEMQLLPSLTLIVYNPALRPK